MTTTVLICGACGRRCGTAYRDDHGRVMVELRVGSSENGWRDDERNADPVLWSLTLLPCDHCGAVLHPGRNQANKVGHERRVIVPVSTPR